jgi:hypothetical protein
MEGPPRNGGLSSSKRSFPIRRHGQEYFIRNTVCRNDGPDTFISSAEASSSYQVMAFIQVRL